ncbi:S41 family peptidase [Candidatus Finniella inopinata]|uniref:S41 family peptidase n=1 Tax=Candidatus Finniella inopinata TaxID=1696036 RepID=A0A4Q7DJ52_9PROT|nr:S41 family peptidase [Candidatus Finniella inopinata]RZI46054.1 S41 family peptidase [Candidatus Finniella inopinata]
MMISSKFLIILFLLGWALTGCNQEQDQDSEAISLNLEALISEIIDKIRQDYVDDVPQEKLIEGALNGLLANLDPYSGYLNAQDYKSLTDRVKGDFAGLGLEILVTKGVIKVIAAIDETPAFKAGIKAGDTITHINNQEVHKLSNQIVLQSLQGAPGTEVTLTIVRQDAEPFVVTLKRAVIEVSPVRFVMKETVAYIRLSFFSENASYKLGEILKGLRKSPTKLQGLILDLRDNPGGALDQAVGVASQFLDSGLIVEIKSRNPAYNQKLYSKGYDLLKGVPMVVLINKGTASASEIVSGALRDHKRAIIMGTRSFGKGSVQTLFSIPGHGGVRLTTARFYTPKGHAIQERGVEPDITIENTVPQENSKSTKADLIDAQLQRAIDLLRGLSVFQRR